MLALTLPHLLWEDEMQVLGDAFFAPSARVCAGLRSEVSDSESDSAKCFGTAAG